VERLGFIIIIFIFCLKAPRGLEVTRGERQKKLVPITTIKKKKEKYDFDFYYHSIYLGFIIFTEIFLFILIIYSVFT
jgi:hypothetical protein